MILVSIPVVAQEVTGYQYPAPDTWQREQSSLPPTFAPLVPFRGIQEICKAKEWNNAKSNEYQSSFFIWISDTLPLVLEVDTLIESLTYYYEGLYKATPFGKHIEEKKPYSHLVGSYNLNFTQDIDLLKTSSYFDFETIDNLTGKPLLLHIKISRQRSEKWKALLFEVSPKAFSDKIWEPLDEASKGFQFK